MRGIPIVNVARYLLLDRVSYLILPGGWSAGTFLLDVAVLRLTPAGHDDQRWVGGLSAAFAVVFVLGVQAVARALPFGLTLGVSRRTYFLGASTLALGLAAGFGLVVGIGQIVERATDGWGIHMAYFRLPGVLDGPWWLSWLTASAAFMVFYAYGMWYGLIYRRAGLLGAAAFGGVQASVLALVAAIMTWAHDWTQLGHFLATTALTWAPMILVGAAAVLLAGGLATIRRLPV
jgi:hypothetical protein